MMYIQLYEAFGPKPFETVFAEYSRLGNAQRPKSDDEKRDQWLTRLSKATGKNLGPFFQNWGVPTSKAARTSIENLPNWMPPNITTVWIVRAPKWRLKVTLGRSGKTASVDQTDARWPTPARRQNF